MADNPTVRSRVNSTYDWRQPEIAKVSQVILEVVLPFFAPEPACSGSLVREGSPEIRQEHSSFDSWRAVLSQEWDWFDINLDTADRSRHARIQFNLKMRQVNAWTDIAGADTEPLTELLGALQESMSLGAPRSSIPRQKERLEGQYHVERPQDVIWFEKLLELVENWVGPRNYFNGNFSLATAPQFRHSPSEYADWKSQCLSGWKEILDLSTNIQNEARECSVRYDANRADLSVSFSSYDRADLAGPFTLLEEELPIVASKNATAPDSRKSERRRYFASDPISSDWFEQSAALIRSIAEGNVTFQGSFRSAARGEDSSRTDFEVWRKEVKSKWNDLVWVYCWISAREISITMNIDLLRDLVSLDLQSASEETITRDLNRLELALKLNKVQGNPYQYRRFLRSFTIKEWTSNQLYADAVQAAVAHAFPDRVPGQRVAMPTAYVAVGDKSEDLESFTSYEKFCAQISAQAEFARSELVLEGPHGRTLGIQVDRKTKLLTLRTSLERDRLDSLTGPFRNAMDLTLKESEDAPEKEKAEGNRISKAIVFTAAVSILGALLSVGGVVLTSQRGLSPLRKQYSLEIIYPASQSGVPVKVVGQDLRIEWKLIEKNLTGDHPDLHSKASVVVVPEADPHQLHTYPGFDGAAVIRLAPGSYWVKVVSDVDPNSEAAINVIAPDSKETNTESNDTKSATKTQRKAHR